ncbi:hypothetical protein E2562_026020 [Oryza meyeriana var. granulata]|uniref:SUI1 domain-containing protein n=1 Tax=Oryza meyeriana var. granulata TaxID=110450 RepID=A0A6G1EPI4_9ORYZ|nr:hypothetical protein E2562_026020 [Oryza meyeriana var. granulata]
MESSSPCKLLLLLLLHVVLLAPLLQARPFGHGRLQVAPLIVLPSDGEVAAAAASPRLDVPGDVRRPGGVTPPSPRPHGPVTPLADDGVPSLRRQSPPPPSPDPGASTRPLSDDGVSGKQKWPAPPVPQGNKPPIQTRCGSRWRWQHQGAAVADQVGEGTLSAACLSDEEEKEAVVVARAALTSKSKAVEGAALSKNSKQRNGRKTLTIMQGLNADYNYAKVLRDRKRELCSNGTVVEDKELSKIVQLQGDHRNN